MGRKSQVLLFPFLLFAGGAQAETLGLTVEGAPKAGTLHIGIFNSAEGYEAKDTGGPGPRPGLVLGERYPVPPGKSRLALELPPGTYAIKLFLDLNGNGKIDTNFLGIPKEPYGFSNNAKGSLGPPAFEAAAFELNEDRELTVNL